MNKVQLLKPRFICKADFPGNRYEIGDVILAEQSRYPNLDKYPAIFRSLHWYENREMHELPKYVKVNNSFYEAKMGSGQSGVLKVNTIWEVLRWENLLDGKKVAALPFGCDTYIWGFCCEPAEKEDFENSTEYAYQYQDYDKRPFGKLIDKTCTYRIVNV